MKYNLYVEDISVEAVFNRLGGTEGVKGLLRSERVLVDRDEAIRRGNILNFERNVPIVARRLDVGESFTKNNLKVKFGYIDDKVVKLFGKSQDVPAGELAVNTLLLPKHDPEIMVALGPQSRRFIKLGQFYQLIEAQGHGQEGPLLVNGYANIAYILDENGAPWAVNAFWDPNYGGWIVHVISVANLHEWLAGRRVLSQVG